MIFSKTLSTAKALCKARFSIFTCSPQLGFNRYAFESTREAVRGCDIVTTVTADKTNATILLPNMIEPGMHINAVGGDSPGKTELHLDILYKGPVFVEYEPQHALKVSYNKCLLTLRLQNYGA